MLTLKIDPVLMETHLPKPMTARVNKLIYQRVIHLSMALIGTI